MSQMMQEVRQFNEEAKSAASQRGGQDVQAEELPEGTSPVEARPPASEVQAKATEEAPQESAPAEVQREEVTTIKIGDRTFTSEREAIAFAQELERQQSLTEAHAAGIREALEATRIREQAAPEPEDNFEERFYANPKETLKEVQARARDEAVAVMRAEQKREQLWNQFLGENPDLRRKDAERILNENWDIFGKMTDLPKAMSLLARKTRAEYEEIRELAKPRVELQNRSGAVSPSSAAAPRSVTPAKKEEAPLDFIREFNSIFKR